MKNIVLILFIFISAFSSKAQLYQMTRGHYPNEIYFSSVWYVPVYGEERYDAVFYSNDNGETIGIRYYVEAYSSDMPIADLHSDATPGVIYDSYHIWLWFTDDFAYSWDELDPPGNYTNTYTSGVTEGELYILRSHTDKKELVLLKSTDYGKNFETINDYVKGGRPEVGTKKDEIYVRNSPSPDYPLHIRFSNDGGVSFNLQSTLDTTIGGHVLCGQYPVISRGVSSGELYLVTWHYPANYKIYYSNDYGQSFEHRYTSDTCDLFLYYAFTAGVEQGSFYVKYHIPYIDGVNTELHILYSNDTAKTFTEYVHFLDENFPVSVNETRAKDKQQKLLANYPNPFTSTTQIKFLNKQAGNVDLSVYTTEGKLVRKLISEQISRGYHTTQWDGKDDAGKELQKGIYLISLITDCGEETMKVVKY